MNILRKFESIQEIKFQYLLTHSKVHICKLSKCVIDRSVNIRNSNIFIAKDATITIGKNVKINNVEIYVEKGSIKIDDYSIIESNNYNRLKIIIHDGSVIIGNHTKIACDRIWVRFGGNLTIGNYTNINGGCEIRCDEKITIGSYTRLSYNVRVWDTNTHSILAPSERKKLAEKYYPYFGYEDRRPSTKPISIGDFCWLGEGAAILKGTKLGDSVTVGFRTILTGKSIVSQSAVVQELSIKVIDKSNIGS